MMFRRTVAHRIRTPQDRGLILPTVLWVLTAAALLASGLLAATRTELDLIRFEIASLKARSLAEAGIYRAILALHEPRRSFSAGLPELPAAVVLEGHTVSVQVENEAGKIDINTGHLDLIRSALERAGMDSGSAADLVARWAQLRDQYTRDPSSNATALAHFAKLLDPHPGIYGRVVRSLTVDNGSAGINPRVADAATLLSTPGMSEAKVRQYVLRRERHRLESPDVRAADQYFNDHLSAVYTIGSEARVDRVTERLRTRVRLSTDRRQAFEVLDWTSTDFDHAWYASGSFDTTR